MMRCVPLNARSEFAKLSPAPPPPPAGGPGRAGAPAAAGAPAVGGAGAASGGGAAAPAAGAGAAVASVSAGVGVPPGLFGSKNPSGFGRIDRSSMFLTATPASRRPGFNPTRGSLVSVAVGRSCATPAATAQAATATLNQPRPLALADCLYFFGALRAPRTAMRAHTVDRILIPGRLAVQSLTTDFITSAPS